MNEPQTVTSTVDISADVDIQANITVSLLNGYDPQADFVLTGNNQSISGVKTLSSVQMIDSNVITTNLNSVRIDTHSIICTLLMHSSNRLIRSTTD